MGRVDSIQAVKVKVMLMRMPTADVSVDVYVYQQRANYLNGNPVASVAAIWTS